MKLRTTATLLSAWDEYSTGCIPLNGFLSKLDTFKNPKSLIEPQDYFQDGYSNLVTVQNQHRYERKSERRRVACTFKWPNNQKDVVYKLPVMRLPKVKSSTKIRRFKSLEKLNRENERIKASDCIQTKRVDFEGQKQNISLKLKNPLIERRQNMFFTKYQENRNSRSTSSLPRIHAGQLVRDRLELKKTFLLDSKRFLLKDTLQKSKETNPKFLENLKKLPKKYAASEKDKQTISK